MCGRYLLKTDPKLLTELLGVPIPPLNPRYNIAPSQQVLALRVASDGSSREAVFLRWGLVPSWADDFKVGYKLINARSETAASKPSFRSAFKSRRCLIPADGFYEWKATGKKKQPYLFQRPDGKPFVFAGLWEHWDGGDKPLETCTILTTKANAMTRAYHERMPVIPTSSAIDRWLDHSTKDVGPLAELLKPAPVDFLTAVPVSMLVNSPKNDTPECIEPVASARSAPPSGQVRVTLSSRSDAGPQHSLPCP